MTMTELIIMALGLSLLFSGLISACVYIASRCIVERSTISGDLTALRAFERARSFLARSPKLNTTEGLDMTVRDRPAPQGVAVILRRKVGALTRYIVTFRGQQIGSFSSYAAAATYAEAMGYKVIGVRDDHAS